MPAVPPTPEPASPGAAAPAAAAHAAAAEAQPRTVRVPVSLLRFHQPMAEHGPGACAQPIGMAPPPGHTDFRSTSE